MHTDRRPAARKTGDGAGNAGSAARKDVRTTRPGDFTAYVGRNAQPAYRLMVIALDDPVLAQDVVHDALMAAWQAGATWPASSLDAAFGRRLVAEARHALRTRASGDGRAAVRDDLGDGGPEARNGANAAAADAPRDAGTAVHVHGGDAGDAPRGGATVGAPAGGSGEAAVDDVLARGEMHGGDHPAFAGHDDVRDRLVATVQALPADELLVLVEEIAMPGEIEPVADVLRGRGSLDRRLRPVLAAVSSHAGVPQDNLIERLGAILAERDPGDEPSQLRWRLQRSLIEAEQAEAEQAEIAESAGWGFAVKFILVIALGVVAISAVSMAAVRQNATPSDAIANPLQQLTASRVVVVAPPVESASVHVAATRSTLVAALESSQIVHSARGCARDLVALVDESGTPQWLGDVGVHVDAMAGDVRSTRAFLFGRDDYCNPVQLTSADGGRAWQSPAVVAAATGRPSGESGGNGTGSRAGTGAAPSADAAASAAPSSATRPQVASLVAPAAADWLALDPVHLGTVVCSTSGSVWASADGVRWVGATREVQPIGFDPAGRLVGWSNGAFVDSYDDGGTWLHLAAGPAERPVMGAALVNGVLAVTHEGLWWYPYGAAPRVVQAGQILAVQPHGDSAVAVGTNGRGHFWIGTINGGLLYLADLPAGLSTVNASTAEIAINDSGALVALSGQQSAIAFVAFAR